MKAYYLVVICFIFNGAFSQELFVVTDPGSNVPSNSLAVKLSNSLFDKKLSKEYSYGLAPEITYGLNKNLMFRGTTFLSNKANGLAVEGGSFYSKYRLFSSDDLNSHFRMAAYGRFSFNNSAIHQEEIDIMSGNSGFETGLVATKLIHKVALSSSLSFEKALDNSNNNTFPDGFGSSATNYTFSVGKLMYPKKYTSFKQTNINLMLEFVGQTINDNGKSYLDVVPAVQFIINSQARIDLAYRHELMSSMIRTAPNGVYLNFEYNFYNVF